MSINEAGGETLDKSKDGDDDLTCCQRVCYSVGFDCCHGGSSAPKNIDEVRDNADRTCTDVPFCILLICIFIAQSVIFGIVKDGKGADPSWLIRGRDFLGNACAKGEYYAWPDPSIWGVGVCASSCNVTNTDLAMWGVPAGSMNPTCGYDSFAWLEHWCIPDADTGITLSGLGSTSDTINKAFGDIVTTKNWLIISAFVALCVGFVYTKFLEKCTKCVVWTSIVLVVLGGFCMGYVLMENAAQVRKNGWGERASNGMWTLGAIVVFLDIVGIIVLCFMTKAINLACDVVEQAAAAFQQIWTIVFFPVLIFIAMIGYFAFWFIICIYIASVEIEKEYELSDSYGCGGTIPGTGYTLGQRLRKYTDNTYDNPYTTYKYYEFDEEFMNYMWFHIFCGFWTVQFIIYWSYAVTAGVFAEWYFSPWKSENVKEMGSGSPIGRSMWRITRYHTGTIAFGSLIIAVIRFIRAVFLYIQAKMMDKENPVAKCCVCCINCFLSCVDCCIDKLTKDGFVFTSIYGTPFCSSAIMAFNMIMKNLVNVAALALVSDYVEIIGKLAISIFTTGLMLFILDNVYEDNEISSYMVIALALMSIAYLVAIVFMHLFDVAIETLFLCYVIDLEATNGNPKYASASFQKMVDKHKDANEEAAAGIKSMQRGSTVTVEQMRQEALQGKEEPRDNTKVL